MEIASMEIVSTNKERGTGKYGVGTSWEVEIVSRPIENVSTDWQTWKYGKALSLELLDVCR